MFKLYQTAFTQIERMVYAAWPNAERTWIKQNQEHRLTVTFTPLPHAPLLLDKERDAITKQLVQDLKQIEGLHDSLVSWTISNSAKSSRKYDRLCVSVVTDIDVAAAASASNTHIQYHLATTFPSPVDLKCPYCGQQALYSSTSTFLYHGRDYGAVYFCPCKPDGVYVGCHKGTSTPLGELCDSGTRLLRSQCHKLFDPYWKVLSANMRSKDQNRFRNEMYSNLAKVLKIEPSRCHFSMFDETMCRRAIAHLKNGDLNQFLSPLQVAKLAFNT